MERSRKIFLRIASASHRVVTAANEYADLKDTFGVQRSHFQLEEDMRKISVACECIARILSSWSLSDCPAVDVRLQDWLGTDEPRMCFEILSQVESLLQEDVNMSAGMSNNWKTRGITVEDKITEAVNLFDSRKGCFHFLFTIDIWNHESHIQRRQDVIRARDYGVCEPGTINILGRAVPDVSVCPDRCTTQSRKDMKLVNTRQQKNTNGKTLDEILKWLGAINCAEKQDITLSLRQPDTCKWLFSTSQYISWRDGVNSFMWMHGKPGSGKSVLVASVINSLETSLLKGEILTFFYCDFRNERSTHAATVMRSILSQLLHHFRDGVIDPENLLVDLVKSKHRGGATRNSAKELAQFVSDAAKLCDQKPWVVVDALDECKDIRELLQALTALKEHVRLFVTSRPVPVIKDSLSGLPLVSLDDMGDRLSADIELHVTRELDARRRLRDLEVGFKAEIRLVLCGKADGMFRWVQCSLDTLERCVTRKEVRRALDSLPEGLDETYERILLAIDTKTREGQLALRALVWLVAAVRPLRLLELMEGLSINLRTRKFDDECGPMHDGALLDACGSLVTYSEKTGIIVLSHFSVKEYLIGELILTKIPQYHIDWERAHLQLARSCMCYISHCIQQAQGTSIIGGTPSDHTFSSSSESQPLIDYVLNDALNHIRHLGPGCKTVLQDLKRLEVTIRLYPSLWDSMCLHAKRGRHSLAPSWPTSRHDFVLYILVVVAPHSLLNAFLRRTVLEPRESTNPLVYAAHFNRIGHAQTLLRRGAQLNRRGWEIVLPRQAFPLEVALYYRHHAMVAFFVDRGSTVPKYIFTQLLSDHYDPVEIPTSTVKTLLQTNEFVEAANGLLCTPISQLALISCEPLQIDPDNYERDLLNITRRLTQVGCDPFARNSRDATSLHIAVERGHTSIIHHLLSLGAPFPAELLEVLSWNIWKRVPVLHCLLEHGVDVHLRTTAGESFLHITIASFIEDDALTAAKLLVGRGCDPLKANHRGETPLQIAVGRGYVSVVQFLQSVGVHFLPDVLLTLGSWTVWKKFPMIHYLVENGAKLDEYTTEGDSILHIALLSLNEEADALAAAKLLTDRGCKLSKTNSRGETVLHVAFAQGHISVVHFLLSQGVPFPSELSTLNLWKDSAKPPMIHFLVENAADILVRSGSGDSLLQLVMYSLDDDSALKAVKLLISHGCAPCRALQLAIIRGHLSVVQYLLSLGTLLPSNILAALDTWNFRKKARMVHLLIQKGVDVLVHTSSGHSVLHIVLMSFSEDDALETVKTLVARGCDHLIRDSHGEIALEIAIGRSHVSVVQLLLSLGARLPPSLFTTMNSWEVTEAPSMLRFLIKNGASVRMQSRGKDSVLHMALRLFDEKGALETTKLLGHNGCDALEVKDFHGKTPLHIAVERGHVSVVRFLLSLGVSIPSRLLITSDTWVSWRRSQTFCCLVENGADVHVRNESGDSVLHTILASFTEEDALDGAKLLIPRGCDPLEANSRGKTPLRIAVERGHASIVQYLLLLCVPLPSWLLLVALKSHDGSKRTSMIRCLVESGADVHMRTARGDTLLHIALRTFVEEYALEASKVLVIYGCDPLASNFYGETPINIAIERGHMSVVKHLHSIGARFPGDILFTILNSGKCLKKLQMLEFLVVVGGASVHSVRAQNGDSLLHTAISSLPDDEICSIVVFLVEQGCSPTVPDTRGIIPLHTAVARGHVRLVNYLRSISQPLPSNILFIILQSGHSAWHVTTILRLLIESGADAHATTNNGDTLLHVAIGRTDSDDSGWLDIIRIIVSSGCDPQIRNAAGRTPLYLATIKGRIDVVEYLLSVVDAPQSQLEDLLPATALGPANVQYQMRRILVDLVANSRPSHFEAEIYQ